MKKIFAALMCVIMVFTFTSVAFAAGWAPIAEADTTSENYNVNIYKLEKVVGVTGETFRIVPNATAVVGDVVYFTGYAIGDNAVQAMIYAFEKEDYILTDLANIQAEGQITEDSLGGVMLPVFSARVTGTNPSVAVTIKSGNDVMKVLYDGKNVVTDENATEVTLGDYKFVRDRYNVVTEVYYNDTQIVPTMSKEDWDKAVAGLVDLGITMDAVKNREIYMSNEHLVRNFGNYSETTKIISWAVGTVVTPGLPQTGDNIMPTIYVALSAIVLAAIIFYVRRLALK